MMTAGIALGNAQSCLESLGYDLEVVPKDLQPLVHKLIHDALVAQGTAAEAQSQAERHAGDLQAALEKVSSLSRFIAEKEREVAYLRQDLAAQTMRATDGDVELKSQLYQSEKRILVLESAVQQESAKSARLEHERDGLKLKVQSLLEVSQQCKALEVPVCNVSASMDATAPLTPPRGARDTTTHHQGGISLIKVAASRVAALESELSISRKKAEEYKELSSSLKEANAAHGAEIAGLKAQLAATRGALDLQTFEELSRTSNKLSKELEELRQRSVDPKELAAAHNDKEAAEARAAAAEAHRQAIAKQVDTLRRELSKLQDDADSVQCAENKVAKLRVALDDCKAQEAAARAAAELAEGRCSELQDRLERRDAALKNAQARCRSLEADLCRLRQLQSLKASKIYDKKEEKLFSPVFAEENEEIAQLKSQCAAMAAHLQKSMELQEAALEAATTATAERDEITDVALRLKSELEMAKLQLQDAAAAVKCQIKSPQSSSTPVSELSSASLAEEVEEENGIEGSTSCSTSSSPDTKRTTPLITGETQVYIQNSISDALAEVEAARCDATEAQVKAQQAREVADTLRDQCAELETQVEALQNNVAFLDDRNLEMSLRFELGQKIQECNDLAAAGAQADAAMHDCLEQLRIATTELQQSREAASTARSELHNREMQLESLQNAAQALDRERITLHEQLIISQAALQQQNEGFVASFEAEREAAATEFDTMRSHMQVLSRQYQEMCAKASAIQRERDAATQFAEASATEAALYEQEMRAKESALGQAEASCAALVEENRRLQEAIMALQQEVATQTCAAQFSNERTHAALQRRAATAEGSTALLEARLSDAMIESSTLRQQLAAQATRKEELEALLLEERKKQFQEENMNIDSLSTEEEDENDQNRSHAVQDAVDEAMMQRLSELEIECVQLREELARVQHQAGIKEENNAQSQKELLDRLNNVTKSLIEEQRRRELLENDARAALLDSESKMPPPPAAEENLTPPPESLTAQTNVLHQLSTIAEGLKGLGSR